MSNINGHWLKFKKVIKEILKKPELNMRWFLVRSAIEWANSLERCAQSSAIVNSLFPIRFALKTNANSIMIFHYFLYNFLIFSQWPLMFGRVKLNSGLYRFVLKILKFEGYSSIVFLVRYYSNISNWISDNFYYYVIFIPTSPTDPPIFHTPQPPQT